VWEVCGGCVKAEEGGTCVYIELVVCLGSVRLFVSGHLHGG
jgi:hypothetical protein